MTVLELWILYCALHADVDHGKGCPWRVGNEDDPCSCGLAAFEDAFRVAAKRQINRTAGVPLAAVFTATPPSDT